MRTWEEVKDCMRSSTFADIQDRKNSTEYKTWVDELIYYVKLGLSRANMKYLAHKFSDYTIAVLIERDSKLYICDFSYWSLRCAVYLCANRQSDFDNNNDYWFRTKCVKSSFYYLSAEKLFSKMRFPKHPKYKIGDLVKLNAQGVRKYCYYYDGDKDKILRITDIDYRSNRIDYKFEVVMDTNNESYRSSYAECNLVKINGGV